MVVSELITILGISIDPATLAAILSFQEGMSKIESLATKAAIAVGAFATAAIYTLKTIGKDSENLVRLAQQTGVSTDYLQQMGYAVEQLGGDSKSLQNDILGLAKSMTSPIPGQFNETLFQMGVVATTASGSVRNIEDVFNDLAARFKTWDNIKALQWGSKLGISNDIIRLLQQGREGVKQLMQLIPYIVSRETLENGVKFNQMWKTSWETIKNVNIELTSGFYPAITKVLEKFNDWVREHKEFIHLKVGEVVEGISAGLERFWAKLQKVINAWKPYIKALMDAFGLTGTLQEKTEKFVNIALWGLALLAGIWILIHSKMLIAIVLISILMSDFSEMNAKAAGENNMEVFFNAVAVAATLAADAVGVLAVAMESFIAFYLRMWSYAYFIKGQSKKGLSKVKSRNTPEERRAANEMGLEAEEDLALAEGFTIESNAMQEAISAFRSKPFLTSQYINRAGGNKTFIDNKTINVTVPANGAGDPNLQGQVIGEKVYNAIRQMDTTIHGLGVTSNG